MVCEHEYMNMDPSIIELARPLWTCWIFSADGTCDENLGKRHAPLTEETYLRQQSVTSEILLSTKLQCAPGFTNNDWISLFLVAPLKLWDPKIAVTQVKS